MENLYEVAISYEKMMENGKQKKVTEKYLCEAISVTESEARIIEEMAPFITGEFTVKSSKVSKINEVFISQDSNDGYWFKCKLMFLTIDEKSGSEKKTSTQMLVQAADFRDAVKKLDEGMKKTMADYIIDSISESKIVDFYRFESHVGKED